MYIYIDTFLYTYICIVFLIFSCHMDPWVPPWGNRNPKEAACEKQASSSGMLTEYRDRILEPNRCRWGEADSEGRMSSQNIWWQMGEVQVFWKGNVEGVVSWYFGSPFFEENITEFRAFRSKKVKCSSTYACGPVSLVTEQTCQICKRETR